jgi:HEAT repeat protein/type 1 glutamine amidotransferase
MNARRSVLASLAATALFIAAAMGGLACDKRPATGGPPSKPDIRTPEARTDIGTPAAASADDKAAADPEPEPVPPPPPKRPAGPVRVLVLSGRNNHDWRSTTPELVKLFEDSPRFEVELTDDPASLTAARLERVDVLVSNWSAFPDVNGRQWGPAAEEAFLDFVRSGRGFALFHAASATLSNWAEYQELVGATWGKATGHGPAHAFKVSTGGGSHAITRGMPDFWIRDELWHRMPLRPGAEVVCRAFSAKEKRGTGAMEPVVLTTRMGAGRGFNLVLGHDVKTMRQAPWRTLMLRGAEWAATGEVTVAVPKDWPTVRLAVDAGNVDVDAALAAIKGHTRGSTRKPLVAVEELVQYAAASRAFHETFVPKLTGLLGLDASVDCKRFVCGQLSLVGRAEAVPILARLLNGGGSDDARKLATAARCALERMSCDEALAALRAALADTEGAVLAGVVNSLGERRDAASAAAIAGLLGSDDDAVAGAAVDALGKIGGTEALKTLAAAEAKLPEAVRPTVAGALLRCADGLLAGGGAPDAARVYERLSAPGQPKHIRVAAFPGWVACRPPAEVPKLLVGALSGDDRDLRLAALRCIRETGGAEFTKTLAEALPGMQPEARAGVLDILAERGDPAAAPAVVKQARGDDALVRRSALRALGGIGGSSVAGTLAELAGNLSGVDQRLARNALVRLRGDDVDAVMARLLGTASPAARAELATALGTRKARGATNALLGAAGHADSKVRRAALRALGDVGDASTLPRLVKALSAAKTDADRREMATAITAICRRASGTGDAARPILDALGRGRGPAKAPLVAVLGRIGGPEALEAVRGALDDTDAATLDAAVRALADWPTPEPLADLVGVARSSKTPAHRVLALRGFARLAPLAEGREPAELVRLFAEAMKIASSADERKALLAGLGNVPAIEAMRLAAGFLGDAALVDEAGLATAGAASSIVASHPDEVRAAMTKVLARSSAPAVRKRVGEVMFRLSRPSNLALGATASSPDGLGKDGAAGGDAAVNDGNPDTYWDEVNGQKLYRLRLTFKRRTEVAAVKVMGYKHHDYAPRDFEIVCDERVVATVKGAVYEENELVVTFQPTRCTWLELKITGCYGASPAVRELEVYGLVPGGKNTDDARPPAPAPADYDWEKTPTSLALTSGGKVVWRMNHDPEEGKPYIHPLGAADGTVLTALRPRDHTWHRAVWSSWKFLAAPGERALNYWEEDRRTGLSQGRTELDDVKVFPSDDRSARIEMRLSYRPPGKDALLTEARTIDIAAPDEKGAYSLVWRADFTAGPKGVKLTRTPLTGEPGGKKWGGYAGFSLRLARPLKRWRYANSEDLAELACHGKPARWVVLGGKTPSGAEAAVAVLDHPSNPRHPTCWYVDKGMPYFSPAPIFKEAMELGAGEKLSFRYKVLVIVGRADPAGIEKEWKAFAAE